MTRATFAWSAEREGNTGVITEHRPDGTVVRWRIAAASVPVFLAARRRLIAHKMQTLMSAKLVPDADYEYLQEPSNDQPDDSQPPGLNRHDPRRWGAD